MTYISFDNSGIYHIYNRGVEKRDIFLKEKDYLRFIVSLYEFNSTSPAISNAGLHFTRTPIEVRLRYPRKGQLVEILAFCLMPNHFHLMVKQKVEGGITMFMRKLGTGYTNYFNLKYNRVGALFQGKFKAKPLERDAHFIHLPHYIHLNPLDIIIPEWRDGKVTDLKKAFSFLKTYRWSSLQDYLGIKNFPTVTNRELLTKCIGKPKRFYADMEEWMQAVNFEFIQNVLLE